MTQRWLVLAAVAFGSGLGISLSLPASLSAQTLRDEAKRGFVEHVVTNHYQPVSLSQLIADAHTIVVVRFTSARASLIKGDTQLVTDYGLVVDRVLKRASGVPLIKGDVVTMRRAGGVIELEGKTVTVIDPDFPQLSFPATYVVFLMPTATASAYDVVHGPLGVFRVDAGRVQQVSEKFGTWNAERGRATPLDEFVDEIETIRRSQR